MKFLCRSVRWLIVSGLLLTTTLSASAASLYIDPATSTLNRGDAVTLALRLNVDRSADECINAADIVLSYSENIEPVDTSIGSSIFRVWVEEPKIDRENRTITLAGGIPNGYCGRIDGDPRLTNVLAELVFRSPGFVVGSGSDTSGQATVEVTAQSSVYRNDGRGTRAPLTTYPATMTLTDKRGSTLQNAWQDAVDADTTPPEEFTIRLYQQDVSGKWVIAYSTTDKQTGIDQYQIIEEPIEKLGNFEWGRADAPWITPDHPNTYVLEDQTLNSVIRVRAIDKAGNEYVATLVPDESLRTDAPVSLKTYGAAGALVIVIAILLVVGFVVLRQNRRRRQTKQDDDPEMVDGDLGVADEEPDDGDEDGEEAGTDDADQGKQK